MSNELQALRRLRDEIGKRLDELRFLPAIRSLYEAAVDHSPYGCHVDVDLGEAVLPDCVIDYDRRVDCGHAGNISCREECRFWKPRSDSRV